MLTCKEASKLISQSLDQPLTLSNRIKLRFHLFICDACKRFNAQMFQLRSALSNLIKHAENDDSVTLSAEARAKIAKTLESEHH